MITQGQHLLRGRTDNASLADQVRALRQQVAELESRVRSLTPGRERMNWRMEDEGTGGEVVPAETSEPAGDIESLRADVDMLSSSVSALEESFAGLDSRVAALEGGSGASDVETTDLVSV